MEKQTDVATTITEERITAWKVLSEIFLDTYLADSDYSSIANELQATSYNIHDIEDILRFEVFPACRHNLKLTAGEWTGFERQWLINNITLHTNKRRPLWYKILFSLSKARGDWERIKEKIIDDNNNNHENI